MIEEYERVAGFEQTCPDHRAFSELFMGVYGHAAHRETHE